MLTKDDLIFAKILLTRVPLHALHCKLILEEFFSCGLQALLLDRAWHVALFEDGSGDENIVVDLVRVSIAMLIRGEQESVEVILVLSAVGISGETGVTIDIDDGRLADSRGLCAADHRAKTIHGLRLTGVTFGEGIDLLHEVDLLQELFLGSGGSRNTAQHSVFGQAHLRVDQVWQAGGESFRVSSIAIDGLHLSRVHQLLGMPQARHCGLSEALLLIPVLVRC